MQQIKDYIAPEAAGSLVGLFLERARHSPDAVAYRHFSRPEKQWLDITWSEMTRHVACWQLALRNEGLSIGDRVALMLRNCPQWVMFEQAALGLGLVVVPLYTNDRPENICYILQDAGVKILLIENGIQWRALNELQQSSDTGTGLTDLHNLQRIVSLGTIQDKADERLVLMQDWLSEPANEPANPTLEPNTLATIVYTSGTTGRPKGVMLSHRNILSNAAGAADCETFYRNDVFLSFLPLSHMFERTAGYYMPMMTGATVTYARSIDKLAEDLLSIRPTVFVTVPRIFERVYNKIQVQLATKPPFAKKLFDKAVAVGWQRFLFSQNKAAWHPQQLLWPLLNTLVARKIMAKLGGRMRLAISGGAPLSFDIAKTFIGLGLTISQGYGMTEVSPVVSTNLLQDNDPSSVGQPLKDVEIRLGDNDELQVRGPSVMLGYWNNQKATDEIIDSEGWLHTGDKARIENNHIYITGRLKEIIVMANGEKVPPSDIELAITSDPLIEQVMLIGEGRPFLSALVVLNEDNWHNIASGFHVENDNDEEMLNSAKICEHILQHIAEMIKSFPGYAKVFRVYVTLQPWSVDEGLITPTLKLRRNRINEKYENEIEQLYAGHR